MIMLLDFFLIMVYGSEMFLFNVKRSAPPLYEATGRSMLTDYVLAVENLKGVSSSKKGPCFLS